MKTLIFILLSVTWANAQIPTDCTQVVVGISNGWNSSHASLTLYEKRGGTWEVAVKTWQTRLGENGLAWGRGLHPIIKSSARHQNRG